MVENDASGARHFVSRAHRRTAMSGLSARTSSCGGEGARFGLGGDAFGGGAANFVAFFAFKNIGASFLTSSSGASDRLLSESESMASVVVLRY